MDVKLGTSKVIGAGLNKTGTKTLQHHLIQWGYRHRSYDQDAFGRWRAGEIDQLLDEIAHADSFEDWPWPLLYKQASERFPDAKFVLTIRRDPETWFRSLCKMAVRMGPLNAYEKHVYGYAMPQGHKREHLEFYQRHNREVIEHFASQPERLLVVCWETGQGVEDLPAFLGVDREYDPQVHINRSRDVYGGNSRLIAEANRIVFQRYWGAKRTLARLLNR